MDYVTVIEPVREITLAGTAEDERWRDVLHDEGLPILSKQGRVGVLISIVDSTYKGIRFQELSVSVQMDETRFFLMQAYNSRWLFALAERTLFKSPYDKGTITAQARHPMLSIGSQRVFEATLTAAPITDQQHECNELQIYLPKRLHKRSTQLHFFHARLEGNTEIYTEGFTLGQITPHPQQPVWELLQKSGFRIEQWRIRSAARHSKSKTYQTAPEQQ